MQRDGEIPKASDVNSFRRRTLIIFHKCAANLRSTKLRRGLRREYKFMRHRPYSTTKKLFFLRCKPVAKLIPDKGERKKNMPYARVSESQEGRLHAPRYPWINIYTCTHASTSHAPGVLCVRVRVSFVDVEKKKGFTFRARSTAGFHTFALTRSLGISFCFFQSDLLFVI